MFSPAWRRAAPQGRLIPLTLHLIQPYGSRTRTKPVWYLLVTEGHSTLQLSAHHMGIFNIPGVITHCPPWAAVKNLQPPCTVSSQNPPAWWTRRPDIQRKKTHYWSVNNWRICPDVVLLTKAGDWQLFVWSCSWEFVESCSSPDELHSQSTGSPSHTHDCVQDWMKRSRRSSAQSHSPAVCRPQRIQWDSRSPAELSSRPDGWKLPASPSHCLSPDNRTRPSWRAREEPEWKMWHFIKILCKVFYVFTFFFNKILSLEQMTPTSRLWEHSARLHEEMEHSESFVSSRHNQTHQPRFHHFPLQTSLIPQQTQQSTIQLSTEDTGSSHIPACITHCAPFTEVLKLHSSRTRIWTVYKPEICVTCAKDIETKLNSLRALAFLWKKTANVFMCILHEKRVQILLNQSKLLLQHFQENSVYVKTWM